MKNIFFFLAGLALPVSLHAQFYPASSALLQSGIIHGTERERHYSMRMQALGTDFSGYIDDGITDLYRNPVFFHRMQHGLLFGELVRQRRTSLRLPALDTRALVISSALPLSQAGRGSGMGLLLRGNYAKFPLHTENIRELPNSYSSDITSRENLNGWAEAQVAWGFSLFNQFSAGVSYTYGRNEGRDERESLEADYSNRSFSSGNTIVTESQNFSLQNLGHTDQSHILRFGLLREKASGSSWDAVTTVELFSATPERTLLDQNYERESINSPYLFDENVIWYDYSNTADLNSTNLRLDFRYRHSSSATRSMVVQLGAGVTWFSSEDSEIYWTDSRAYRATAFDTTDFAYSTRTMLAAAPGGFGFQMKGGLGWNFEQNNFLFAIATLASYQRLSYDDMAYEESLYERPPFPLFTNSILYNFVSYQYRLALPLGMEYQTTKKLSLRAGWVALFRGETLEQSSNELGETGTREATSRTSSQRLDVSTVTFGMGYQIFDQLRADLLNFGNLSQPQDWSLSVIYSF